MEFLAHPPCLPLKEVLKYLMNIRFCNATNRTLETDQNGILVNITFDNDGEQAELDKLVSIYPPSLETTFRNKKYEKLEVISCNNQSNGHKFSENLNES